MFKSFLIVSFRNLKNNKGAINISLIGLLIGLTASQFIFNYVYHEMTYDRHLSDNIFRIEKHRLKNDEAILKDAFTDFALAPLEIERNSSCKSFLRMKPFGKSRKVFVNFHNQKKYTAKIRLQDVYFADSTIIDFVPFKFLQVNSKALLTDHTIMISESAAKKVFTADHSNVDIVNNEYYISRISKVDSLKMKIVAIYQDLPKNSHLRPQAVASMSTFERQQNAFNLPSEEVYSYVKFKDYTHRESFYNSDDVTNELSEYDERLYYRAVKDIHTAESVSNEPGPGIDSNLIFVLLVIGTIIMILADANYVNNTILNSVDRIKEVGLRKLLGAGERQVFTNIINEFILFNLLTGLISFGLYFVIEKIIQVYVEHELVFLSGNHIKEQLVFMLLVVTFNAVLCGIYPAFHQLSTKPIEALYSLRSAINFGKFKSGFQIVSILIIFQLTVSVAFLSAVYIFYEQMLYQKEGQKPPYEFEVKGIFPGESGVNYLYTEEANRFIQKQFDTGDITELSMSNLVEGKIHTTNNLSKILMSDNESDTIKGNYYFAIIDHGFWKEKPNHFLAGSDFNREFNRDCDALIVNQSAVKAMGFDSAKSIIGKKLKLNLVGRYLTVKGVVKDDELTSAPSIYATGYGYPTFMNIRLNYSGQVDLTISEFIKKFERKWSRNFISFYFLDDDFALEDQHNSELFNLFLVFSILALIIANLGLYGLTNFIAQKKKKEISIRKIMGAELHQILFILLIDLLRVLAISTVIAVPGILYFANEWLNNFHFRIDLQFVYIFYPLLITFVIALVVVTKNSLEVAAINPADSLRDS